MKKMSLEWHAECATNLEHSLRSKKAKQRDLNYEIENTRKDLTFLRQQIEKAIKEGKTGFDKDKYNKPRK